VTSENIIALTNVTVGYGLTVVLNQVNWTIQRGESWYVIGRNGAGKSTLLATILGRLPVLAGQLQKNRRLVMGTVPQHCRLINSMPVTIREFVGLGLFSKNSRERKSCVTRALDRCDLQTIADSQVLRVSGGQRRRAMIAQSLALQPDVLVLDEPSAGLDTTAEQELLALIDQLRAEGVTIIYITHDLLLVAKQSHRVALIANGTLQEIKPMMCCINDAPDMTSGTDDA
jgi:zinc/manganese transport system ATP-binding protein